MKLIHISSSVLPEIDDAVKECVNRGQWLLFRSPARELAQHNAAYFLRIDSTFFALTESGGVVEQMACVDQPPQIEELIYFSDLPQPASLSNSPTALYA